MADYSELPMNTPIGQSKTRLSFLSIDLYNPQSVTDTRPESKRLFRYITQGNCYVYTCIIEQYDNIRSIAVEKPLCKTLVDMPSVWFTLNGNKNMLHD